jgi:hypothetical protein
MPAANINPKTANIIKIPTLLAGKYPVMIPPERRKTGKVPTIIRTAPERILPRGVAGRPRGCAGMFAWAPIWS